MEKTLLILAIGLPWMGALLVWLLGRRSPNLLHGLAVGFSVLAGAASLALLGVSGKEVLVLAQLGGVFGDVSFVADGLGVFLTVVATVIGSLAVIFSVDYMKGEPQLGRYYAFVLFFIGAMVGLVLTNNLLLMFVFWEITALTSYALISFKNDDPKAVAGGIKALIMTQLGGIGLLAGALLLWTTQGSCDIAQFLASNSLPPNVLAVMAFGCLVAAAAKSAQFPFQTWLPDAMEAPTPISALIHAATMVNAGVYLLARFYPAFKDVPGWTTVVVLVGMVTALLAAVMALVATDLKRVLAYSTVSQLGFMVYAVGSGGIYASQFHLLSHSVFKALLFLAAGSVIHAVGTRDMRLMGGLGRQMPLVRTVFTLGALALMGVPILNGFWSKELILESGLKFGEEHGLVWAYALMVVCAGLTALYTTRCLAMVFWGQPRGRLHGHDAGPAMRIALIPLAAASLLTWLLAGPFGGLLANVPAFETLKLGEASTLQVLEEVLLAPATLLALGAVLVGAGLWWLRPLLAGAVRDLKFISWAAQASFGFEALNRGVVGATQRLAEKLRDSQTGLLNWNLAGILIGLVVLLAVLGFGGR